MKIPTLQKYQVLLKLSRLNASCLSESTNKIAFQIN